MRRMKPIWSFKKGIIFASHKKIDRLLWEIGAGPEKLVDLHSACVRTENEKSITILLDL
jgi:hypothetical protein